MSPFLLFAALVAMATPPISLRVDKRQGFPPLLVHAEIVIPRHVQNREACVTLFGPVEDSSCWELSEASAPVFRRKWQHLGGGRYVAQARLRRGAETFFSNLVELYVAESE